MMPSYIFPYNSILKAQFYIEPMEATRKQFLVSWQHIIFTTRDGY